MKGKHKLAVVTVNRQNCLDLLNATVNATVNVKGTAVVINRKSCISDLFANTEADLEKVMQNFQRNCHYRPFIINLNHQ